MKTMTVTMFLAVLGLAATTSWGAMQYKMPLPAGMLPERTFLDGYVATPFRGLYSGADPLGAWAAITGDEFGNTVQEMQMHPGWTPTASKWVHYAALQWSGVNFTSTGTQDVWLSWMAYANTTKTITYTLTAGPDADHLTTRCSYVMPVSPSPTIYWTNIGNAQFYSTDMVVKLTLDADDTYQLYCLGVDELVFAVPEPASLGLLALGGLALLRRRR